MLFFLLFLTAEVLELFHHMAERRGQRSNGMGVVNIKYNFFYKIKLCAAKQRITLKASNQAHPSLAPPC